jgi:hypothetical protein
MIAGCDETGIDCVEVAVNVRWILQMVVEAGGQGTETAEFR